MMKSANNTRIRIWLPLLFGACLLANSQFGFSEIYKSVNKNGEVTYTDQPNPNAKPVDIKEVNTVPGESIHHTPPVVKPISDAVAKFSVSITSPSDQQLFPNRLAPFTVAAKVTPRLAASQTLRLLVDGQPSSTGHKGNFVLKDLSIGQHTLQVELLNGEGAVIAQSKAITIYTRQPGQTRRNRNKRKP